MSAETAPSGPGESLLTRGFVLLGVADLAYFTAGGISVYALPLYVTGPLDGSEGQAGIAFGVFALASLVLRPFAGRLCDDFGRRPLLVGGALLAGLCVALTAATENLAGVVALRALLGVAEAAFFVASLAALIDLVPAARMAEATSYNSLGLYLGLALGPPLGEVIIEQGSYDAAWLTAGVIAAAGAGIVLLLGETGSGVRRTGPPPALLHRPALPASLAFCSSLFAVGGFLTFAAIRAEDVGIEHNSLPLLGYGFLVVVLRATLARGMDRHPPLVLGAVALALITVGLLTIALWGEPAGILAGAAVLAVGVTLSTPAFFAAVFATASPTDRGAASGTLAIFLDLGLAGGPIMMGLVSDAADLPVAFAATSALTAAGALWAARLQRRGRITAG